MSSKSHLRPQRLFVVAFLATLCMQTHQANAGAVTFYVPIRIEHAPPEMTHGAVTCYLYDPAGHAFNGDGGNGSFDIVGGRYYRDLEVIVRRPDNTSAVGHPVERGPAVSRGSTYGCRLCVGGDLPVARGTPWATESIPWVRGRLSGATIREINELGCCPCGCGGDAANGTAACSSSEANGVDYTSPIAGAPPGQPKAPGEKPRDAWAARAT